MGLPDWFVLIREWVDKGYGANGLTLPFLVGALARKESNNNPTAEDARALINEMITAPVAGYVTEVSWCSDLGAPVFRATPDDSPLRISSALVVKHPTETRDSLVLGTNLESRWGSSDPQSLIESLIKDAEGPIEDHTYSRNHGQYANFQPGELELIEATIMNSQK